MGQPEAPDIALGRAIVARVAPEELPYFDETAASLSGRPLRQARRRPKDDPLAFGGAAELVVTSIACGVAFEVVKMMGETLGGSLAGRFRRLVGRRRARREEAEAEGPGERRPTPPEEQGPALTEERIAELGAAARRTAILLGLPPDRSDLLAAAVRDHLRAAGGPGA
ncbi:hypothetical protein RND61_04625 [Streptomyces sp. TRM76323]|uniref:Uncharacterized protein n=1 Tax=Streptomyces tamarix TaxID=3078565 RepID=A0ABU3QF13_9ACTN|nr:hypothetical protein [Streptomyces tamarix]MDT9681360.1 hypothetical protein [Streptomyces tamarix]